MSLQRNGSVFRKGFHDGIPIALGYVAVSFTLGIAARNAGLTAFQATVMSLLNNTSAGEFAALGIISAGAPYLEMAISQAVVNLRYLLMSCSLSQKLDPSFSMVHRFLMGYTITDEVFGISIGRPDKLNPFYSYGAIFIAALGWATGTCLGVILGNALPARVTRALSVALYGMFLAVIIPSARGDKILTGIVLVSMAASFLFAKLPLFSGISSGMQIIILTVLIAGAAAVLFPIKEEKTNE